MAFHREHISVLLMSQRHRLHQLLPVTIHLPRLRYGTHYCHACTASSGRLRWGVKSNEVNVELGDTKFSESRHHTAVKHVFGKEKSYLNEYKIQPFKVVSPSPIAKINMFKKLF